MGTKMVVMGGGGLIGRRLVALLRDRGCEVLAASRSSGIDAVTGEGLETALAGAKIVVDVTNSPSFEDNAVMAFFKSSTQNLQAAEQAAGVEHHVALSVVGADRLPDSGYMRAKVAQEALIRSSGIPYTILRATQFFEFAGAIAESAVDGDVIRLPPAMMQPVAADDVALTLADIALSPPANDIVELAGPEKIRMDDLARRQFAATGDSRQVQTDPGSRYFGTALDDESLTPGDSPRIGAMLFQDWLTRSPP